MGPGENFVAPHINPRFAAAMGGMDGAMNYHLLAQQQQLFYQHQQQMQMQIHMQQQNVFGGDTTSATWGSVTAASYEDDNVPHKSDDLGLMDSTSHHPVDEWHFMVNVIALQHLRHVFRGAAFLVWH
jgi:hypothetical protein